MKIKLQTLAMAASLTLSASLLASAPAKADDAQSSVAAVAPALAVYTLNDSLQIQVLGVLNDMNSSGAKLGAAVRIINTSSDTVRIPDHELRLRTEDGLVYTLSPSLGNAHGIPAQSEADLTYMRQLDRSKGLNISELSLVDVNYDVYPKKETNLITVPVGSQVWTGNRGVMSDPASLKKWGEPFTVPTLQSPLTYTPVSISKSYSNKGATYLVRLLVSNPSDQTETVPIFEVDGKSKADSYRGTRVETGTVTLEPGDKTFIHYAINTDLAAIPESLNILALEPFGFMDSSSQRQTSSFGLGKLNISLPVTNGKTSAIAYEYGSPIALEAFNDFVNPDMKVSLVELHATESMENGYKTTIAKLKLDNKSDKPIPLPALVTELENGSGSAYTGTRQAAAAGTIQPGTSMIVSFAYSMPTSETDTAFSFKLQGVVQSDSTAPSYRSTIAVLPVSLQPIDDHNSVKLYPYTINFKSWFLTPIYQGASAYTYKLHLDADLGRDPAVVLDNNFSTLKFELIDGLGRSLGAQSFPFVGPNRIVSGDQWLVFSGVKTDQNETNLTVRVSESIVTPSGEATRIIANLQP